MRDSSLHVCLWLLTERRATPSCVAVLMLALCGILTTWHRFCAQRPHISSSLQWEIHANSTW